VIFRDYF
jgi:hypothetical protein